MIPFTVEDSAYVAWLDDVEVFLVSSAIQQTLDALREVVFLGAGPGSGPGGAEGDEFSATNELEEVLRRHTAEMDAVKRPTDPAALRLLPDGSEDPAAAHQFRRLTQLDLAERKVARLAILQNKMNVGAGLGHSEAANRVEFSADEAPDAAATLTDVRLMLGDRLGITDGDQVEEVYEQVLGLVDDGVDAGDLFDGDLVDSDTTDSDPGDSDETDSVLMPDMNRVAFVLLGLLQDSLVEAMLDDLPDGEPGD